MKKKKWLLMAVLSLFLMGCDDVLTVVTVNEDGERVTLSYISFISNTVYDSTISLTNWRDVDRIRDGDLSSDNLLFTIVNNTEKIVVFGDAEIAMEIRFFGGGYRYTMFFATDGLSEIFNL